MNWRKQKTCRVEAIVTKISPCSTDKVRTTVKIVSIPTNNCLDVIVGDQFKMTTAITSPFECNGEKIVIDLLSESRDGYSNYLWSKL